MADVLEDGRVGFSILEEIIKTQQPAFIDPKYAIGLKELFAYLQNECYDAGFREGYEEGEYSEH